MLVEMAMFIHQQATVKEKVKWLKLKDLTLHSLKSIANPLLSSMGAGVCKRDLYNNQQQMNLEQTES